MAPGPRHVGVPSILWSLDAGPPVTPVHHHHLQDPGHPPSQALHVLVISRFRTPDDKRCEADTIKKEAHRVACNRRVLNRAEGESERFLSHPVLKSPS
jgi:hypothetical protein